MAQMPPWPMPATVVSQDADNYALNVTLDGFLGGQMPSLPVKVLTHGPRDAVLGNYPELPRRGTRGLVAFARGDIRSGHWLGATDPALVDASALSPQVGNAAYRSHYGGGWSWRGEDGTVAEVFPDGSSFLVGTSMPAPTRHTLTATGARQRTPFPASQRVPQPPAAFPWAFTHPTGAAASLDASGSWSLTSAPGQPLLMQVSGGASVQLNANGSIFVVSTTGEPVVVVAVGGTAQAIRLADGSASTVLKAQ